MGYLQLHSVLYVLVQCIKHFLQCCRFPDEECFVIWCRYHIKGCQFFSDDMNDLTEHESLCLFHYEHYDVPYNKQLVIPINQSATNFS